MGYTHLWEINPKNPRFREHWPQVLKDAQRIVAHAATLDITLAGGDGTGAPQFDLSDGICLDGNRAAHQAGDAFVLDPEPWQRWAQAIASGDPGRAAWATGRQREFDEVGFTGAFCKTKRRPYDAVVCAILLRARYLAPNAIFIATEGK